MKITNCADALRRHHFEVETVRDTDEAFAVIKAAVETERPETVSFGDSMSMRATGVIEWLRGDGRYRLLDKTGVCSDCNSPDRVCNTRMEMLRCWPDKRVLVVLIDQDLGL